jgi:uncharacterized protein
MSQNLSYSQLAHKILEKSKIPLSSKEIWDEAIKDNSVELLTSKGEKPWNSIKYAIHNDIKNDIHSHFYKYEDEPDKYTLKKFVIDPNTTYQPEKKKIKEADLHAVLCAFVNNNNHFRCKIKRIDEKRGRKKRSGLNEWANPDMVGVALHNDLEKATILLQKELSQYPFLLFSFELKLSLTVGNLRSSYFQAVSNSSWANEGYLVTLNIKDEDRDFFNEITLLNNAFGIGIIQLNIEDICNSQILLPARFRENLDWLIINKLVENNPDFKEFIEDVTSMVKNEICLNRFDEVPDINELEERFRIFFM